MTPFNLNTNSTANASSKGGDGAFGGTSALNSGDWNVSFGSGSVIAAPKLGSLGMACVIAAGLWWITHRRA